MSERFSEYTSQEGGIRIEDMDHNGTLLADLYELPASVPEPTPGVSVSLYERAEALATWAKFINERNKITGVRSIMNTPDNSFTQRYGQDSREVLSNMDFKASQLEAKNPLERLAKTEELIAAGFDPISVQAEANVMEAQLESSYAQPGMSRRRQKLVTTALKTAQNSTSSKRAS